MTYKIISTGSQGNAVIIENILIDCGVSFKALKEHLNNIKLICLTHIHTDHFNKATIKKIAFEKPRMRFACCSWLVSDLVSTGVKLKNIDVLEIGKKYDYGAFMVSPIKLYHNVQNCGYRLYMPGFKAFYATDTGSLEGISAKEYDFYFIEANYTNDEINERIKEKQENGIYSYEYDVIQNHLSKEKTDDFLLNNMGKSSQYVYLHKHIEKGVINEHKS